MRTKALENHYSSSFWMSTQVKPFRLKFYLGAGVCLVLWLLTSFLFSQTAYATSYINVSSGSGGTVSLGSIRPSSSGTSSTGSDTLTIHTDCSTGYSVYVSGQKDKDTNLTNSSASSNNTIATSSTAVGSTATALSSNTWGLNSENTGTYVGLPTYANATSKALISKSSVSESSTVPIYYGVKVNTSLAPGTYTGNVLYTVMMDSSCLAYTVIFNSNGGSGTMDSQSIMAGTATSLTANSFTRDGYAFLGWSTKATGKTGTASNGIGTEADIDYADKAEVTDLTAGGSSITLYAIWQKVDGTMQSFSCASLASGGTANLQDTRDGQIYSVYRIPTDQTYAGTSTIANIAGRCIMTKDLNLGAVNSVSGASSSITANEDMTLSPEDSSFTEPTGSGESITIPTRSIIVSNTYSDTNSYSNKYYKADGTGDYAGRGSYSWGAAMVVCPKGWRLPTADEYGNSTSWEGQTTGLAAIVKGANATETIANITNSPYFFALSGGYSDDDSGFDGATWFGLYWSSTQYDPGARFLYIISLNNNLQLSGGNKRFGLSVRCIAQDNYTISYSADGADSGEASKTSEVVYESGSVIMPTVGSMVKSGYEFKGWALTSGATEAAYTAEESVSLTTLLSAASSSGHPGSRLTLYPVWEQTAAYMQDWTECSTLSVGQSIYLTDSRDNRRYAVKKLPDNKCWMVQNLALGMDATEVGLTLTKDDTNTSSTYYLPPAGKQGSSYISDASTLTATDAADFSSDDNRAKTQFRAKDSDILNDSDTGYYNFYTATLGFSYNNDGKSSGSSDRDICPKGWRLPDNSMHDFRFLSESYNLDATWKNQMNWTFGTTDPYTTDDEIRNGIYLASASPLATNVQNNYAGFSYAGYWSGTNASATNVGTSGTYWTSSIYFSFMRIDHGYDLYFNSSEVHLGNGGSESTGYAVRCIAKDALQENTASSLPENETVTLRDARDNQSYTVYRWPSSGTAGTDYPTGMAGYAIMTKDLSLGYITGGSVTKGESLTLTATDSNFDSNASSSSYESFTISGTQTVTARASTSDWSTTSSYTNIQYINGTGGTHDDHSYYSYGAAIVVCPKGWRLPTMSEYDNIVTFMGGMTDGSSKIMGAPYNFAHGGEFDASYGWYLVGSDGNYWSSTQSSSTNANRLYSSPEYLWVDSSSKDNGLSVRCISALPRSGGSWGSWPM